MISRPTVNRRDALKLSAAASLVAMPADAQSKAKAMPHRPIPGTSETVPVLGLGSSKAVSEIGSNPAPLTNVLKTLVEYGGTVVDTWPRNAANDTAFGKVIARPELKNKLFITTKIDRMGKDAGLAQFRDSLRTYGRKSVDLTQIFSLTDLETQWPTLKDLKAAGQTRYIGVTVSAYDLFSQLEQFLKTEKPDFVQVNYSITERRAAERLLPLARDRGVAVLINRPFMNGDYFQRLKNKPLPSWAAAFGCESWAQFSLKYILAHPDVTCVLAETTNPRHMAENARATLGPLPDPEVRAQMVTAIEQA